MRDISKNVRDDIIQAVRNETLANVKSVYSPTNAFYLLTFPATEQTFCFDTRMMLEDGSYRTTVWPELTPKGLLSIGSELYFAQPNGIAQYRNYLDETASYAMSYYSNYFDLEMPNINKIIKKLSATTVGATGQTFSLKVGYEYSPVYFSETFTIVAGTVYEYGIAEYNVAEYTGSVLITEQSAPAQGSGNIVQIGFTTTINGTSMSLQKLSIYAKQGKVL
tara:strand:- start:188 stop:850 length:663 start_codon:yes stop_codon:yes gene_type:complete